MALVTFFYLYVSNSNLKGEKILGSPLSYKARFFFLLDFRCSNTNEKKLHTKVIFCFQTTIVDEHETSSIKPSW